MRIYTVGIEGMSFKGFHGCREDEKKYGNVFKVDFDGDFESDCAKTDNLDDTLNYGPVYQAIASVMNGQRRDLMETLVSDMIDKVREEIPGFTRIRVKLSKKNPPVAGECEWSSITEEWRKV